MNGTAFGTTDCWAWKRFAVCWSVTRSAYSLGWSWFGKVGGASGCLPGYAYRVVDYDWFDRKEHGWECQR